MNFQDFIKNKKLEIDTICDLNKQNYGAIIFNTGYTGKENTTACIIFDKNLDITFLDNTISQIYADKFSNIFNIRKKDFEGVINYAGKEIIPCIYDSISLAYGYREPNEKIPIWVRKDKKETLFSRKGKQLIKFYDDINIWEEIGDYFIFQDQEYSGIMDYSGNELFRLKWTGLKFLTSNILTYRDNFEYGLIDINGKILAEAKYEDISVISYPLLCAWYPKVFLNV